MRLSGDARGSEKVRGQELESALSVTNLALLGNILRSVLENAGTTNVIGVRVTVDDVFDRFVRALRNFLLEDLREEWI